MKNKIIRYYFIGFSSLIYLKNFGLFTTYNGQSITNAAQFEMMTDQIKSDSRFTEYLNIRERIMSQCTTGGPLISSNYGVVGAHLNRDHIQINSQINYLETLIGENNAVCIPGSTFRVPNTDLMLQQFYAMDSQGLRKDGPVNIPVSKPATLEEIRNPNNNFYALSSVLHTVAGSTEIIPEYSQLVKCYPTAGNPEADRQLRFNINDSNNPCLFRTAGGDSGQPFFVITQQGNIRTLGTHNPGGDYFMVENMAYPSTAAFINETIETVPEPLTLSVMGMGLGLFYRKRQKTKVY